jgi:hypothetical protein
MNSLLTIACGAGLQDGFSPCVFMSCAVFIAWGLWFSSQALRVTWLRVIFGLAYIAGVFNFNFGPAQILILRKEFIPAAKIFYFVLGAWAFVLGVLFFKDWLLLNRGKLLAEKSCNWIKDHPVLTVFLTIVLGLLLSALSTIWPANNYILVLGNAGIVKGQWQSVLPMVAGYVLMGMWPLWLVWAFFSIKNLRLSLVRILYAAIFFTASSCMILAFK